MNGKLTLIRSELDSFLCGRGISVIGSEDRIIQCTGISALDLALPSDISFCRLDGEEGQKYINNSAASVLFIVDTLDMDQLPCDKTYLLCNAPRLEILRFITKFWSEPHIDYDLKSNPIIHSEAVIEDNVKIGPFSVIGPGVCIKKGVTIGANCHIENTLIEENSIIGSSVTIGGAGFGFEDDPVTGDTLHFPHIGRVVIGSNLSLIHI